MGIRLPFVGGGRGKENGSSGYDPLTDVPESMTEGVYGGISVRSHIVLPPEHFGKNRLTQTLAGFIPKDLRTVPEERTMGPYFSPEEAIHAAANWETVLKITINDGNERVVKIDKSGSKR